MKQGTLPGVWAVKESQVWATAPSLSFRLQGGETPLPLRLVCSPELTSEFSERSFGDGGDRGSGF